MSARILVVEDDPIVSGDIERTIRKLGFECVGSAATAKEAIRVAEETKPEVVLMDISLKGPIDGITAGAEIKNRFGAALIYVTAYSDEPTFNRAKITEPYGYIVKPFNETDLRINIGLALYKRGFEAKSGGPVAVPVPIPPPVRTESDKSEGSIAAFLGEVELFSSLAVEERRDLAVRCRKVAFRAGELISYEGSGEKECFIVISGRVSLFKSSPNGRELVVELLPPKDLFTLVAAFEDQPSALTARTRMPTEVLFIPKNTLFGFLSKHPEFYKLFVREANRRLRAAYNVMRAMAHDKVEARIAAMLAELTKRSALCVGPGLGLKLTRQELADLTGTSAETAIRITRAFEEQGLLELSKRGTILIKRLEELKSYSSSS